MDPEKVEIEEGVTVSSPDTPEDVSPAEETEPSTMAEAVEAAMKDTGEPSDPGTEEAEGEGQAEEPDQTPKADGEADSSTETEEDKPPEGDPTEEEMKNYSQKANARIRGLVEERNQAAQKAERVEPILDFLEKNDIPQQDLDVILDLTARLRHGDFQGFLTGIGPYVNLAQQYTGQVLPPDLQQQVRQGYVSPEIAKELAQRRAQVQVEQQNVQRTGKQMAQVQTEQNANSIRTAVGQWEQQIRRSDPDYDLKADVVRRTSQALMQEHGAPKTPQQALQMAQAAYDEVNGQMTKLRPTPKATKNAPRSTGQQGGSAPKAEPTSMMDAAMQALEQRRA